MFSKEKFNQIIDDHLGNLSIDEKQQMFEAIIEKCFENLTEDEFENTKSKFMKRISDKTKSNLMMEMMSSMMGGMQKSRMGSNSPMMRMCTEMMGNMSKSSKEESYSTDELMDLFKDWCSQVEDEIVAFINETGDINEDRIGEKFNLSKKSVTHLLKNLNETGKIKYDKEENEKQS
jgi:hypothetical protein